MFRPGYEGVKESTNTLSTTYNPPIQILNSPNGIPSLAISLTPNSKTGNLTIEDLIERVKDRYAALGLTKEFPVDRIKILVGNIEYSMSNKTTEIHCNGSMPNIRIMFPKAIDKQYLIANKAATESTSLTGKEKPRGLFGNWFS